MAAGMVPRAATKDSILIALLFAVASLEQSNAACTPGATAAQCQARADDDGRPNSDTSGHWLSLLQREAALVEKVERSGLALAPSRLASPTLAGECADLDDVQDQIGALNDTADAAAEVAAAVNSSAGDLLGEVDSSLNAATEVLQGIQAATKMAAALNGGAATIELVDSFVDLLSSSLTKVQTDLQEIVDAANEKVAGILEQVTGARDEALGKFAIAVEQVTALCDVEEVLSLAQTKKKASIRGPSGWFRDLFRGSESIRGDDYDKAQAAIASANDSAANMAGFVDDLNATAVGALDGLLDSANNSLTALKEEVLPKALESFDGKIPKPVMAIVTKQATAAVDQALGAVGIVAAALPSATIAVLAPIEEAQSQLAAVFAAADSLAAITEDAKAKAELGP